MSKIGVQSGGAVISDLAQLCDRHPISHKLYGLSLNTGIASFIKQRSPSTTLVVRNIGRGLDYGWDGDIAAKANAVADAHIAALSPFLPYDPWAECHNEPPTWDDDRTLQENIDRAKRGNEWQVIVAGRMHAAGFRHVLAYSFSVGTPRLDFWPYYQDGIAACEGLALHEYWQEGVTPPLPQPGLTFRYRDAYAAMRTKRPIMLTELGYGFLSGYRAHTDMTGYLAMLDTYDAEMAKDAYLACAHIFLCSADSGQWATWDVQQDGEYESKFIPWVKPGMVNVVLPPVDPPTGGSMTTAEKRSADGFVAAHVAYNKDAALFKYAQASGLGYPVTNEYNATYDGATWINQGYAAAIVGCVVGDYQNVKAFDWLTGAPYVPPTIPPVTPPTVKRLTTADLPPEFGLKIIPHNFTAGSKAWWIVQAGGWKIDAGTELIVHCIPLSGPAFDINVTNRYASGAEKLKTDGAGNVKFDFGPGSGFTPPIDPPNHIYVAAADQLTPVGDELLFGFPGGHHLEGGVTMQEVVA